MFLAKGLSQWSWSIFRIQDLGTRAALSKARCLLCLVMPMTVLVMWPGTA